MRQMCMSNMQNFHQLTIEIKFIFAKNKVNSKLIFDIVKTWLKNLMEFFI